MKGLVDNLTKDQSDFLLEHSLEEFMQIHGENVSLNNYERIFLFNMIPQSMRVKFAKEFIDSICFDGDSYTGDFGFCYSDGFRIGVGDISFVRTYQDVIRSLGYAVTFNSWSNWHARGVEFKISKPRVRTQKDMTTEKQVALFVILMVIVLMIASYFWMVIK